MIEPFAGLGFWRLDRPGGEIVWSNGRLSGQPVALNKVEHQVLREGFHPEDLVTFDAYVRRAFDHGEDFNCEYRYRRPDRSWRTMSCQAIVQRGPDGAVCGLTGTVIDDTELQLCRVLTEDGNDIITHTDHPSAVITYVSPSVAKVTGFTPAELIGRTVKEVMGGRAYALLRAALDKMLADPGRVVDPVEYESRHRDGRVIWLESRLVPMFDPGTGDCIGVTDVIRDVTQSKQADDRLERANLLLSTLMESLPSGIILFNEDRKVAAYNRTFCEMWNVPPERLDTEPMSVLLDHFAASVKDEASVMERTLKVARDQYASAQDEIETKDGRWLDRHTVPVHAKGGGYLGRAWLYRDITEHRQALAEAVRMGRFDHLTGLSNRIALFDAMERALTLAHERDQGFAVFCLDLDNFKDVNDTLGHLIGDQLLVAVADRLRCLVRDCDVVARPGGDEFAILASGVRTATDAAVMADSFIREVSEPYFIDGHQIYTSVSIGIELFGRAASDKRTLLSRADMALYQAKSAGAATYRFFTEAMDSEVRTRVTLAAELREAIEAGQLMLLYQPEVEIATGRVVGAEALVRWRHPRRGLLGPDVFVPVAEQMGLIGALGRWVLWTAARQARSWADTGLAGIRMGVNVSALQFKTPAALEADIAAVLAETGLPPALLELELTETALMTASEGGDLLMRLHQSGVRIAIDDFGTGYSSLEYLRRFPASRIKIAQTFVRHLGDQAGDAAIVKATIGLARELGMTAIAEGVETRAQFEMLRDWGCTEAQGYLFDRPLSVHDATRRLRAGGYSSEQPLKGLFRRRRARPQRA
ncbi:MAG: EAL domain-containing protein [Caulobacteraceae bacterium]|nr:EAL domain-containing protein [Caulobacteraceae bacterium]